MTDRDDNRSRAAEPRGTAASESASESPSTPARQPYRTPRLECYGLVTDLVQRFGGGPLSDAGNNRMGPMLPPS